MTARGVRRTTPSRSGARRREPSAPPVPVLALAVVAIAFFALPFLGLLWRAPWGDVWSILDDPGASRRCGCRSVLAVGHGASHCVFGVPLAWLLARVSFPGRGLVRALCTLSMVLPPVVGGVALFFSFGRRGLFGQYLDRWFGITLPFTTAGVVVAQTFVAMPFLVLTVEAAIRQLDRRFEDAARTLGASRWYVFRRVTLPAIRPGLVAGAVLAWAARSASSARRSRSPATSPDGRRRCRWPSTSRCEIEPDEALVLSLVLIVVSFAVLVGLRDRWLGGGTPASR